MSEWQLNKLATVAFDLFLGIFGPAPTLPVKNLSDGATFAPKFSGKF